MSFFTSDETVDVTGNIGTDIQANAENFVPCFNESVTAAGLTINIEKPCGGVRGRYVMVEVLLEGNRISLCDVQIDIGRYTNSTSIN